MKLVLGVLPRDSRHVLWRPCKDVLILTEEVDELAFLFGAEVGTDGDALLGVGVLASLSHSVGGEMVIS